MLLLQLGDKASALDLYRHELDTVKQVLGKNILVCLCVW